MFFRISTSGAYRIIDFRNHSYYITRELQQTGLRIKTMQLKFRNKIFLLCVSLVLGVVLTAGYIMEVLVQRQARETLLLDIQVTQRTFEELNSRDRQQQQLLANTVANEPRLKASVATGDPATVQEFLDDQQQTYPAHLALVTTPQGSVLGQQSTDLLRITDLSALTAIRQAQTGVTTSDFTVLGQTIFEITAAPILSQDELLGILVYGLAIDDARVDQIKSITHSEITCLANDRIMASTWGSVQRTIIQAIPGLANPSVATMLQDITIEDAAYLTKTVPFQNIAGETVGVYLIQRNVSEALGFLDQLEWTILIIAVIAILATMLASFIFARQVSAPVASLVSAANELANGRYDNPIVVTATDEIGYLATAFDRMRQAQQSAFLELERVNKELRQALRDLKEAQNELINNERLSAIGKMAGGIIHDFKNPMSMIKGYTQLLMNPNVSEDKRNSYGWSIVNNIDRMVSMTQDLLDFSRGKTQLTVIPMPVRELIEATVSFHKDALEQHDIKFQCEFRDNCIVSLDQDKFRRALDNLIHNAAEAIGKDGAITMLVFNENGFAHIAVMDTGGGIPEEIMDNLFEPFVTHGKTQGTGLGLSITRKIIIDHGGDIWADTDAGVGTSFHIRLPRDET
jgi:signal transduction histidine kinase